MQVQRQCELEEVLALVPVDLDGDLELRSALGQAELDTEGGIPAGAIHGDPGGALCAVAPGRGVDGDDGRLRVEVCRELEHMTVHVPGVPAHGLVTEQLEGAERLS